MALNSSDNSKSAQKTGAAQSAPRCHHYKLNGDRCGAPALRGRRFCRFHARVLHPKPGYTLPIIEDAASIQCALMQVLRALQDNTYDAQTCGRMLYALQIASTNLRNFAAEMPRVAAEGERQQSLAELLLDRIDHPEKYFPLRKENGSQDSDPLTGCESPYSFNGEVKVDAP